MKGPSSKKSSKKQKLLYKIILKTKTIARFTKQPFRNVETFEKDSKDELKSILSEFQQEDRRKITWSKTYTTIKENRLHTTLLSALIELAEDRLHRGTFPTADQYLRANHMVSQKEILSLRVRLKMSKKPYLFEDETLIKKRTA